jgi:hypothetical protein
MPRPSTPAPARSPSRRKPAPAPAPAPADPAALRALVADAYRIAAQAAAFAREADETAGEAAALMLDSALAAAPPADTRAARIDAHVRAHAVSEHVEDTAFRAAGAANRAGYARRDAHSLARAYREHVAGGETLDTAAARAWLDACARLATEAGLEAAHAAEALRLMRARLAGA